MNEHKLTLVMLNKSRCHTQFYFLANQITWIGFLLEIHIFNVKTVQIQISWQKPTDLDLHCLQRQGTSCSAREGLSQIVFAGMALLQLLIQHVKRIQWVKWESTKYSRLSLSRLRLSSLISTSLISNNRLSRSENLVFILTWKSNNR